MSDTKEIANRYTVEEIDRALSATALFDGNTRAAAKALKGQGLDIPRTTLRDWVNGSRKDRSRTRAAEL